MKKRLNILKQKTAVILAVLMMMGVCHFSLADIAAVEAASYADGGCVNWAKNRARELLGIELPPTGSWPSGVTGASNWWYTLNYPKDQIPSKYSLAIWSGGTGQYANYGHVAFVEDVSGNRILLSEGGVTGAANGFRKEWHTTMNRPNLRFLGYVHLVSGSQAPYKSFKLQTGTALSETGNNFEFCVGDYNRDGIPDLYAIKKHGTDTRKTEVHILNGANAYQSFSLQTGTGLHETGDNFEFCVADYNKDNIPDLYAIKKSGTGSKKTEIHILDGANAYQRFLLHTSTGLHETGSRFTFCVGDYNGDGTPDLYAIKKSGTSSKKTEVHILDGAGRYQEFALQTATCLGETGSNFEFCTGDYNQDGKPDLYAVKKKDTETKKTEVHILNGADKYKKFALQTGTCLETVGKNFTFCVADYNRNGNMDVYAVKKKATGTRKTEVHIFE